MLYMDRYRIALMDIDVRLKNLRYEGSIFSNVIGLGVYTHACLVTSRAIENKNAGDNEVRKYPGRRPQHSLFSSQCSVMVLRGYRGC